MDQTTYLIHKQVTTTTTTAAPNSTACYSATVSSSSLLEFHFLTSHCSVFQAGSTDLTGTTVSHCFGTQTIYETLLEWLCLSGLHLPKIVLSQTLVCCFFRIQLFRLLAYEQLRQCFDLPSLMMFVL